MAWDGSGNFIRNTGVFTGATVWQQSRDAARKIRADDHDTHDEDIATGLENTVTRDGQNAPTADLPMAGRKHTNVDDADALNQYSSGTQVQNSAFTWCGTAGGTANAIALTPAFAISGYVAGQKFDFIVATTNTLPVTINVSSQGAKALKKADGQDLEDGDLLAGSLASIQYDGINFLLATPFPIDTSPTTTEGDLIQRGATEDERLPLGAGYSLLGSDKTKVAYFGGSTAKTANYTVVAGDHRKTILCDSSGGAFTVTLPAPATVGDGFYVKVKKTGTGTNAVTVATAGAETIDGDSQRIIRGKNQLEEYTCDGANWFITSDLAGRVLLDEKTASNSASIVFTDMDGVYDWYNLEWFKVRPATDEVEAFIRFSGNNGSSFDSGSSDYQHGQDSQLNTESRIRLTAVPGQNALSNVANDFMQGNARIYAPADNVKVHLLSDTGFIRANGSQIAQRFTWGRRNTAKVINAIQFAMSSGNIAEGEFKFYGMRS